MKLTTMIGFAICCVALKNFARCQIDILGTCKGRDRLLLDELIYKDKGRWIYGDEFIEWLKQNSIKYQSVIDLCEDVGINKSLYYKIINEYNLKLKYKSKYKNLKGKMFGKWKVLNYAGENYDNYNHLRRYWLCECQCYNHTIKKIEHNRLLSNQTNSCRACQNKKYNTYDLSNSYGIGWTDNGYKFYFDLEDYEKIKDYCWHEHKDGYLRTNRKAIDGIDKMILMHILILNINTNNELEVDHINKKPYDNRKVNLRIVTHQQNMTNIKLYENNTSGITGVYNQFDKWKSVITYNNNIIHLGTFDSKQKAIKARLLAEKKYIGDLAPQRHLFKKYNIV